MKLIDLISLADGASSLLEHRTLRLPDGRTLGWAEYGDPQGRPVLYFHGGLSSRLDSRFSHQACLSHGIRLIAPDRPGIGLSDYQPRRRLTDWPADAACLLDALGIEKASILGWSGGGPYVLACAQAMPGRIHKAATVAGMAPLDAPSSARELGMAADRLLFPMAQTAPWLAEAVLQVSAYGSRRAQYRGLQKTVRAPADRRVVDRMSLHDATDTFREALRSGARGAVQDYRVTGGRWDLDLARIKLPVTVWQGDQDTLVPMSHARRLAENLGAGSLRVVGGGGHFLLHHAPDLILNTI